MKSKLIALALSLFLLVGCNSSIRRDAPNIVAVPVAVMPTPHEDLLSCGSQPPEFVFKPVEGKPNYVQLTPDGQKILQEWIDGKQACIRAWRAWASN